jgi:hypothetical protein
MFQEQNPYVSMKQSVFESCVMACICCLYVCVYTYTHAHTHIHIIMYIIICILFLSTRLLCETQEKLSPVRNVASIETLGTPPSVPDSRNNPLSPVTPTHQLSQSTPLSHLPHSVFPATDLNNLINAAHTRQQQISTGKQPLSLTDSRRANHPNPLSPVSIIKYY